MLKRMAQITASVLLMAVLTAESFALSDPEKISENESMTQSESGICHDDMSENEPAVFEKKDLDEASLGDEIKEKGKNKEIESTISDTKAYSWYCKHRTDGKQPECDAEMNFISEYDGYYLDKNHSDSDDDKVIYLTFDAGYENGNVAKILDILKDEDVKGAFFILENLIVRDTDLVKRMVDEGHEVCNHTASHKDMTKVTDIETFKQELDKLEAVFTEYTGAEMSKFYRPPEGKFSRSNMEMASELGYSTVFWSFAYADWDNNNQMSYDKAKEKVLNGTHNGEIILLHPTSATNAGILKDLITEWKSMGYRFGTLEELISGDREA